MKKLFLAYIIFATAFLFSCCEEEIPNNENALKQINQIIKWMQDAQSKICQVDAFIICGDFNATPTSKVYKYAKISININKTHTKYLPTPPVIVPTFVGGGGG